MVYNKYAKVECPGCNKSISLNNYSIHLKRCRANKVLPYYRLLDYPLSFDVKLYHVIYRTDCLTSEDDSAFLNNWEIYNNIHAQCGAHAQPSLDLDRKNMGDTSTKHEHSHFIGYWTNTEQAKSNKYLASFFDQKSAYKCVALFDETTEPFVAHYRVLQTIYYIQTVNGKHKKHNHKNITTFANDYYKKKHLKELTKDQLWIIVQYQQYLQSIKLRYDEIEILVNSDPAKYYKLIISDSKIEKLNVKLRFCDEVINNLQCTDLIPSYDEVMESYHKYTH